MSLRYTHTLIAKPKDFVPSGSQVQSFFLRLIHLGVVPPKDSNIKLRTPSQRTREAINPFTGQKEIFILDDFKNLAHATEIEQAVAVLKNYRLQISGMGTPRMAPLPVAMENEHFVGVTCFVSAILLTTSDMHEDNGEAPELPYYGKPSDGKIVDGFFTNPREPERVIRVPDAGFARFGVEFSLGNNLFPTFDTDNLELLNPLIVAEANRTFAIDFAQGCQWG